VVCKQLEHVIAGYLILSWGKNDWFYERLHGFRSGYSSESQFVTLCQGIADSLDEGIVINAIIIDFSKAFDFVPHDRLLMKLASSDVDSWVVFWVRELVVGRTHWVRLGGQLSKEVKVTAASGERFLPTIVSIVRKRYLDEHYSNIRLFADDCIIYREITNKKTEKLQTDLDTLGNCMVENETK
jgi:retron-type reverse transcriptase